VFLPLSLLIEDHYFSLALWRELTRLLGTTCCRTTAYHPCVNGLIECFHHQLKASLKTEPDPNRTDALPLVTLEIRTALKDDLKCTTVELVYGYSVQSKMYNSWHMNIELGSCKTLSA